MKKYKVLVINNEDGNIDLEKNIFDDLCKGTNNVVELKHIPEDFENKIKDEIIDADGVISVYTQFNKSLTNTMKKCRIIATQTIGFNSIDLDCATSKGICVTNVPDYCVDEVAIHTVSLALACSRKITQLDKMAQNKIWDIAEIYKLGKMYRIAGKVYGIVSFGNIGKKVAQIMQSLGMKVIAFDPYVHEVEFSKYNVKKIDNLETFMEMCDIISVHTPLSDKTRNMISWNLLCKMKKAAILINTSRGEIIDEVDLANALKNDVIAGAATDVIADETNYNSALYGLENVIITPHMAYYTEEAVEECRTKAATQVAQVLLQNEIPQYLVNKNVLTVAPANILKKCER